MIKKVVVFTSLLLCCKSVQNFDLSEQDIKNIEIESPKQLGLSEIYFNRINIKKYGNTVEIRGVISDENLNTTQDIYIIYLNNNITDTLCKTDANGVFYGKFIRLEKYNAILHFKHPLLQEKLIDLDKLGM